jgi:hypothetical protein
MRALGYVMPNGKEDTPRFALAHGFDKSVVYEWVKDASTPEKHIDRLAEALKTTVVYLLFGIEAPVTATAPRERRADRTLPAARPPRRTPRRIAPIRGGSAQTPPTPAPDPEPSASYQTLAVYWWGRRAA